MSYTLRQYCFLVGMRVFPCSLIFCSDVCRWPEGSCYEKIPCGTPLLLELPSLRHPDPPPSQTFIALHQAKSFAQKHFLTLHLTIDWGPRSPNIPWVQYALPSPKFCLCCPLGLEYIFLSSKMSKSSLASQVFQMATHL